MRAYFLPCAVCGALESERVFPKTEDEVQSIVQAVVICRCCGFVYRRPSIPQLSTGAARIDEHSQQHDAESAAELATRLHLSPGDFYLEIDCGPGWFLEALGAQVPSLNAVLLEPEITFADQAKRRNSRASLLPSILEEADLPQETFALVVAQDADYRFIDHRRDLETVVRLMKDGATLYIERSRFVDTWMPDASANTWFGRDQFAEYLNEFVEVVEAVDRGNARAIYGRRRPGGEKKLPATIRNRYAEHVEILRSRV